MASTLLATASSGLLEGGSIDCPCIDVSSAFVSATSCVVGNKNSIMNLQTLPPELGVDIYIPGSASSGKPTCFLLVNVCTTVLTTILYDTLLCTSLIVYCIFHYYCRRTDTVQEHEMEHTV